MKHLKAVCITLAVFLSVFALPAKETIKIGAILPLSGTMAHFGEDMRDIISVDVLRFQDPSLKYSYQVIYEDSENTPRVAAEAFKKLTDIDHVDMVMSCFGGPSSTVTVLANNKKIVHMGMAFSTAIAKPPYSFNNFAKPGPNAELTAKLCQASGYKRVAFISQQHSSTNALEECFRKIAPAYGIEIVDIQKFAPPEKDFRVALLKLRETKPDLLFVHAFAPEAPIIVKQMRDIEWSVPITAQAHWGTFNDEAFRGIPYVDVAAQQGAYSQFEEHFHHQPVYLAGYIKDSLDLYIKYCESYNGTGKPTQDYIAQSLRQTKDFTGIMGKMTPDANGWFDTPAGMVMQTPRGREVISFDEAVRLLKKSK